MARHTLVVSDLHLADAEPPHPHNPLWKRFKRRKYFIDREFRSFLEFARNEIKEPIELVLNGDIFDFDSVMSLPGYDERSGLGIHVGWLESRRGLNAEEPKSIYKIRVILTDHAVWIQALRDFLLEGHRLVFVIGNHDMELHWPGVQRAILEHFDLPDELATSIRFCEWFYLSNADTLIEHGNQYDAYCLSANPINPLIRKGRSVRVRIPFGNQAGKYMLNGMGLFNPHADSSFIKSSIWEYLIFFFKYVGRTQPLLVWTWFWSALVTLFYSISEGFLPAMTDPMTISDRVEKIAKKANATMPMVWSLKELHAHPAIFNPLKILRELWLDRAILFGFVFFVSFNIFSYLNVFIAVSIWWFFGPLLILLPSFIFYAKSIQSEVEVTQISAYYHAPLAAEIVNVKRVCQGHIHRARHALMPGSAFSHGIEYLNTGTWSPAYHDVECTQPYSQKCFVWIRPGAGERVAALYEWANGEATLVNRGT